MSAAAKKDISKTGQCHVGLCESGILWTICQPDSSEIGYTGQRQQVEDDGTYLWAALPHIYGVVLGCTYVRIAKNYKKIPQTFFLSHIICWKLGNSCETEKKHADALNLSRYVQQNCQDTF